MKTILVLTDLSKKAEHAAIQALAIAQKMKANILLYNCFNAVKIMAVTEAGMWPPDVYTQFDEESKEGLEKLAELLREHCKNSAFKPTISIENSLGDLGFEVHNVVNDHQISLLVMGAKSHDKLTHALVGSETRAILNNADCPVLYIPADVDIKQIKRILLATDLDALNKSTIDFLTDFTRTFGAELILVHVTEFPILVGPDLENYLEEAAHTFGHLKVRAKLISGEHVEEKLKEYTKKAHADLLTLVHRKNSFIARLFLGSHSVRMLKEQRFPLLILPE